MGRVSLRLILVLAVLAGLLVCSPAALARGGAGHNKPTKKLESAFKVALYVRSVSADGCYPPVKHLAKAITRRKRGLRVGVTRTPTSVKRRNKVFLVRKGSNCDRVIMALRAASGLYILNSAKGTIRVQGHRGPRVVPGRPGPPRGIRVISKTFRIVAPDQLSRYEVLCGKRYPIGGGTFIDPGPGSDGEAAYPHSYERLGAQRGFHVSMVLADWNWTSTTPREVTVQAVCAHGLIPQNPSPHKTVFIRAGQTRSATARCPKGQFLITGGFQRTDFTSGGGNYITESRAAGPRAWRVTGSAFTWPGTNGGGELTAVAYCVRHRGKILTEVPSGPVQVAGQAAATATTPSCPGGLRLTTTGFDLGGSTNAFYAGSSINPDNTSTATAFGFFGPATLTAYSYCLRGK